MLAFRRCVLVFGLLHLAGGSLGLAQEAAVIPQVDTAGKKGAVFSPQLLEEDSAKLFTGNIPQVTHYEGNSISLTGLAESYATLIIPVMPEALEFTAGSPVAGQGLIIGTGNTVLYEAEGTGNGFGFVQYGYGNGISGHAYGHNNNALVGQYGNGNRAVFDQFGSGNSLTIMQGQ